MNTSDCNGIVNTLAGNTVALTGKVTVRGSAC
jgi:hypothetical protein